MMNSKTSTLLRALGYLTMPWEKMGELVWKCQGGAHARSQHDMGRQLTKCTRLPLECGCWTIWAGEWSIPQWRILMLLIKTGVTGTLAR